MIRLAKKPGVTTPGLDVDKVRGERRKWDACAKAERWLLSMAGVGSMVADGGASPVDGEEAAAASA